jgi:hypothetical protein
MFKFYSVSEKLNIAELADESFLIQEVQDAVDLLGEATYNRCDRIVIYEKNLHDDFFQLKTKLAGEILQKFSNYRVKAAIVGEFTKFKSKSLQDFIRECNRGNQIFFVDSLETALEKLS